jgi:hypothetical protein
MIFVDTGYLLAVLNPADELFARSQRWATAIEERLITTEHVLWELVNSLSDPVDRIGCLAYFTPLLAEPRPDLWPRLAVSLLTKRRERPGGFVNKPPPMATGQNRTCQAPQPNELTATSVHRPRSERPVRVISSHNRWPNFH